MKRDWAETRRRILALAALAGFLGALAVHLAALSGIDVAEPFPAVWMLHVGIFVVFGPYVFSSRKTMGSRPSWAQYRDNVPSWVLWTGLGIFAYAFLNFALFMSATEGGNAALREGKYLLLQHGTLIRELTQAEYAAFKANEVRGFSGHWMLFYFMPFAYFGFSKAARIPAGMKLGGQSCD
jgi:hypothetical protein